MTVVQGVRAPGPRRISDRFSCTPLPAVKTQQLRLDRTDSLVDLNPTARQVTALVTEVSGDQLAGSTPCPAMTVATLLEHIRELSIAFTRAATKANRPPEGRRCLRRRRRTCPPTGASRSRVSWRRGRRLAAARRGQATRPPAASPSRPR